METSGSRADAAAEGRVGLPPRPSRPKRALVSNGLETVGLGFWVKDLRI